MSKPLDWESVGGYLHRCTRCGEFVVCVRPNETGTGWLCACGLLARPRVPLAPLSYVGTLADYLGVGTGVLVAEWHVVLPDGSLQPALTWRATAGAAA